MDIIFQRERGEGAQSESGGGKEINKNKRKTLPTNQNLGVSLNSRTSTHLLNLNLEQIFASFARLERPRELVAQPVLWCGGVVAVCKGGCCVGAGIGTPSVYFN